MSDLQSKLADADYFAKEKEQAIEALEAVAREKEQALEAVAREKEQAISTLSDQLKKT